MCPAAQQQLPAAAAALRGQSLWLRLRASPETAQQVAVAAVELHCEKALADAEPPGFVGLGQLLSAWAEAEWKQRLSLEWQQVVSWALDLQ